MYFLLFYICFFYFGGFFCSFLFFSFNARETVYKSNLRSRFPLNMLNKSKTKSFYRIAFILKFPQFVCFFRHVIVLVTSIVVSEVERYCWLNDNNFTVIQNNNQLKTADCEMLMVYLQVCFLQYRDLYFVIYLRVLIVKFKYII